MTTPGSHYSSYVRCQSKQPGWVTSLSYFSRFRQSAHMMTLKLLSLLTHVEKLLIWSSYDKLKHRQCLKWPLIQLTILENPILQPFSESKLFFENFFNYFLKTVTKSYFQLSLQKTVVKTIVYILILGLSKLYILWKKKTHTDKKQEEKTSFYFDGRSLNI